MDYLKYFYIFCLINTKHLPTLPFQGAMGATDTVAIY